MRRASLAGSGIPALVFATLVAVTPFKAQGQASSAAQPPATAQAAAVTLKMARDEIIALAKIQLAIDTVRDSVQFAFPVAGNKKPETQLLLQETLRKGIEEVLHHNGLTEADYYRKVSIVSSDNDVRKMYDSVIVALTGFALPGGVQAAAGGGRGGGGGGGAAPVAVPAGPVGVHIGHVMNSFGDTPNSAGLLPTAMTEAATAASHATLGVRTPDDLAMMKTHAGHVIHALDPTVVTSGPGLGYGVKKAVTGVASHIELAAAAEGATPAHKVHAGHVATSARNTVKRADQIVELAKQIQASTTAAQAAALFSQLVPLTAQLTAGVDGNGDGRITWEDPEGGLQQAQEHVMLMLGGTASMLH